MHALLPYFGLVIALASLPALDIAFKRLHIDKWAPGRLLVRWVLAGIVVTIAWWSGDPWYTSLGIAWPTWQAILLIVPALLAVFITGIIYLAVLDKMAGARQSHHVPENQLTNVQHAVRNQARKKYSYQQHILRRSFPVRCLIVATAAVTEEFLFRGYAIGVGQHLPGGVLLASGLSIFIFVAAHWGWGLTHLPFVCLVAIIISALFIVTGNVWVCVFAHAVLDAPSFLVTPEYAARYLQVGAAKSG
jgi:hypothetical protein